jgi:hypothetical protein
MRILLTELAIACAALFQTPGLAEDYPTRR